ncbi:MAG: sulfoxide reductase heme-binding subunit YedZ [Gammaproteobacteria bacterium]|nr:MAG: sulfoxide reductase heme-binding subunit YedZ [Gammaproteobacteria bacterium]
MQSRFPVVWWCIWLAAASPLGWMLWVVFGGAHVVADPPKYLTLALADAAVILLGCTLMVSTLRRRMGINLIRYRRMLGLWTFAYATLHMAAVLTLLWEWQDGLVTLSKRPYALVGASAWLILLLLAATSTRRAQKRLRRAWGRIHAWVYVAMVLVLIHWFWLVRVDYTLPAVALLVAVVLLAERGKGAWRRLMG